MGLVSEFKEFAMKGSVIDLAVGVVIGAAFGSIVSAMVEKVFMPIAGWAMAGVDLASRSYTLPSKIEGQPAAEIGYGAVIQAAIEFVIVAFAIFMVVKVINSARRKQEEAPEDEPTPVDVGLLTEIRDLLKSRPM